ncbi:MAG: ShlB/FhaC/HecB family hemolysin secretion/activation protein [Chlorobiaceae bacterium]|nr:ShlB/FhaC/HecB family hemolysin secretion/activation protein [Chlorobiaceae bacterium]
MFFITPIKLRYSIILVCLLVPFLDSPLQATPSLDAGQIIREQQPQREYPERISIPEQERMQQAPDSGSGVKVTVKAYRFTGFDALVQESELQKLVVDTVGKELEKGGLKAQLARVDSFLKAKGWFLAQSYMPEQDVTSGIIEIRLAQGLSDGNMTFNQNKSVRVCSSVLSALGNDAVMSGQAINERKLERSLLLMNELPGVSAHAGLVKGNAPGTTGVAVDVSEGALLSGAVWEDSYGNYYTGRLRTSALLNINDPSGCGDQLSLIGTASDGLEQAKISYTYPLGSSGLKGNLVFSPMQYKMHKEISALDVSGQGQSLNGGLSYPLVRSSLSNVTITGGIEHKYLFDTNFAAKISQKTINSYTIGLKGDTFDQFLNGGYNTWSASVTSGYLNERIANLSLSGNQGGYARANLGMGRLQRVNGLANLNLSWTAQFASGNLDSSEKFYLGGPFGVRAYPIGEAAGDAGQLFNVDLRIKLPMPASYGTVQLSGFYDAGRITMHMKPWHNSIQTATDKNEYWLQGGGVDLTYIYSNRLSLKGSWAHVIGDNPGRNLSGHNSEGKSDSDRFWLLGTLFF